MQNFNWDDITISKYKEIAKALLSENEVEKVVKILSIISSKDEEYFYDMTLDEYYKEAVILKNLSEMPERPILFKYTVNGKDYLLNPDVNKMTAAQFIDFTTLSAKHPDDYSLILSTLLIPRGLKYGQYDIKIVANELDNMCIIDAVSISFFFQMVLKEYTKASLACSIKAMKKAIKKEKNTQNINQIEILIQDLISQRNGLG